MAAESASEPSYVPQEATAAEISSEDKRQPSFYQILSHLENHTHKTFEDRVSLLIAIWLSLSSRAYSLPNISEVFRFLYRESSLAVLSGHWSKVNPLQKRGLARALSQCSQIMGVLVNGSARLCSALVMTIYDPWGDPVLRRVLCGDSILEDTVREYIEAEPQELLQARIESLVNAGCDDGATRLCQWCIKYACTSNFKTGEFEVIASEGENREGEEWRWCFLEWLFRLLYRKGQLHDLVAQASNYTCHDGVRLIYRTRQSNQPDAEALSETLTNIFLVRDLLLPSTYCCTKELMTLWSELQAIQQRSTKEIRDAAYKLLVLHASLSAHFYLFVDVLWEQFGLKFLPLYLELYIRGLTTDLNHLEAARQADAREAALELQAHMAGVYTKLSSLFMQIDKKIARECILSAFSLEPTQERLNVVQQLCEKIPNIPNEESKHSVKQCNPHSENETLNNLPEAKFYSSAEVEDELTKDILKECKDLVHELLSQVCCDSTDYENLSNELPQDNLIRGHEISAQDKCEDEHQEKSADQTIEEGLHLKGSPDESVDLNLKDCKPLHNESDECLENAFQYIPQTSKLEQNVEEQLNNKCESPKQCSIQITDCKSPTSKELPYTSEQSVFRSEFEKFCLKRSSELENEVLEDSSNELCCFEAMKQKECSSNITHENCYNDIEKTSKLLETETRSKKHLSNEIAPLEENDNHDCEQSQKITTVEQTSEDCKCSDRCSTSSNTDMQSIDSKPAYLYSYHHPVLDSDIDGVSYSLLKDFVMALECVKSQFLKFTESWEETKQSCEDYLEMASSLHTMFLHSSCYDSADSETDSVSEDDDAGITEMNTPELERDHSNYSLYKDYFAHKMPLLGRYIAFGPQANLRGYVNLSDINYLNFPSGVIPDNGLLLSSQFEKLKFRKKHKNNKAKGITKIGAKKRLKVANGINHEVGSERELHKRKKKKKRKTRREKDHDLHPKKHRPFKGKSGQIILKKKKKKKRLQKKARENKYDVDLNSLLDSSFSSTSFLNMVNQHAKMLLSKLDPTMAITNVHDNISHHVTSCLSPTTNGVGLADTAGDRRSENIEKIRMRKNLSSLNKSRKSKLLKPHLKHFKQTELGGHKKIRKKNLNLESKKSKKKGEHPQGKLHMNKPFVHLSDKQHAMLQEQDQDVLLPYPHHMVQFSGMREVHQSVQIKRSVTVDVRTRVTALKKLGSTGRSVAPESNNGENISENALATPATCVPSNIPQMQLVMPPCQSAPLNINTSSVSDQNALSTGITTVPSSATSHTLLKYMCSNVASQECKVLAMKQSAACVVVPNVNISTNAGTGNKDLEVIVSEERNTVKQSISSCATEANSSINGRQILSKNTTASNVLVGKTLIPVSNVIKKANNVATLHPVNRKTNSFSSASGSATPATVGMIPAAGGMMVPVPIARNEKVDTQQQSSQAPTMAALTIPLPHAIQNGSGNKVFTGKLVIPLGNLSCSGVKTSVNSGTYGQPQIMTGVEPKASASGQSITIPGLIIVKGGSKGPQSTTTNQSRQEQMPAQGKSVRSEKHTSFYSVKKRSISVDWRKNSQKNNIKVRPVQKVQSFQSKPVISNMTCQQQHMDIGKVPTSTCTLGQSHLFSPSSSNSVHIAHSLPHHENSLSATAATSLNSCMAGTVNVSSMPVIGRSSSLNSNMCPSLPGSLISSSNSLVSSVFPGIISCTSNVTVTTPSPAHSNVSGTLLSGNTILEIPQVSNSLHHNSRNITYLSASSLSSFNREHSKQVNAPLGIRNVNTQLSSHQMPCSTQTVSSASQLPTAYSEILKNSAAKNSVVPLNSEILRNSSIKNVSPLCLDKLSGSKHMNVCTSLVTSQACQNPITSCAVSTTLIPSVGSTVSYSLAPSTLPRAHSNTSNNPPGTSNLRTSTACTPSPATRIPLQTVLSHCEGQHNPKPGTRTDTFGTGVHIAPGVTAVINTSAGGAENVGHMLEVPTRSLSSISDAVRFSLMAMDDGTGGVENQVMQNYPSFPQEAPGYIAQPDPSNQLPVTFGDSLMTMVSTGSSSVFPSSQPSQGFSSTSCVQSTQSTEVSQVTPSVQNESYAHSPASPVTTNVTTPWSTTSEPDDSAVSSPKESEMQASDSKESSKNAKKSKKKKKKDAKKEKELDLQPSSDSATQKFWCKICSRGFFSAYNLRRHSRNVHKIDMPTSKTSSQVTSCSIEGVSNVSGVPSAGTTQSSSGNVQCPVVSSPPVPFSPTSQFHPLPKSCAMQYGIQSSPTSPTAQVQSSSQAINQEQFFQSQISHSRQYSSSSSSASRASDIQYVSPSPQSPLRPQFSTFAHQISQSQCVRITIPQQQQKPQKQRQRRRQKQQPPLPLPPPPLTVTTTATTTTATTTMTTTATTTAAAATTTTTATIQNRFSSPHHSTSSLNQSGTRSVEHSNCSSRPFGNQNVGDICTSGTGHSYQQSRFSSETSDGLEDLEQFLLENISWGSDQVAVQNAASSQRPSSADSLSLPIPPEAQSVMLAQQHKGANMTGTACHKISHKRNCDAIIHKTNTSKNCTNPNKISLEKFLNKQICGKNLLKGKDILSQDSDSSCEIIDQIDKQAVVTSIQCSVSNKNSTTQCVVKPFPNSPVSHCPIKPLNFTASHCNVNSLSKSLCLSKKKRLETSEQHLKTVGSTNLSQPELFENITHNSSNNNNSGSSNKDCLHHPEGLQSSSLTTKLPSTVLSKQHGLISSASPALIQKFSHASCHVPSASVLNVRETQHRVSPLALQKQAASYILQKHIEVSHLSPNTAYKQHEAFDLSAGASQKQHEAFSLSTTLHNQHEAHDLSTTTLKNQNEAFDLSTNALNKHHEIPDISSAAIQNNEVSTIQTSKLQNQCESCDISFSTVQNQYKELNSSVSILKEQGVSDRLINIPHKTSLLSTTADSSELLSTAHQTPDSSVLLKDKTGSSNMMASALQIQHEIPELLTSIQHKVSNILASRQHETPDLPLSIKHDLSSLPTTVQCTKSTSLLLSTIPEVSDQPSAVKHKVSDLSSAINHEVSNLLNTVKHNVSVLSSAIMYEASNLSATVNKSDVSDQSGSIKHEILTPSNTLKHAVTDLTNNMPCEITNTSSNVHDISNQSAEHHEVSNLPNSDEALNIASSQLHKVSNVSSSVKNEALDVLSSVQNEISGVSSIVHDASSSLQHDVSDVSNSLQHEVSNLPSSVQNEIPDLSAKMQCEVSDLSKSIHELPVLSSGVLHVSSELSSSIQHEASNLSRNVQLDVSNQSCSAQNAIPDHETISNTGASDLSTSPQDSMQKETSKLLISTLLNCTELSTPKTSVQCKASDLEINIMQKQNEAFDLSDTTLKIQSDSSNHSVATMPKMLDCDLETSQENPAAPKLLADSVQKKCHVIDKSNCSLQSHNTSNQLISTIQNQPSVNYETSKTLVNPQEYQCEMSNQHEASKVLSSLQQNQHEVSGLITSIQQNQHEDELSTNLQQNQHEAELSTSSQPNQHEAELSTSLQPNQHEAELSTSLQPNKHEVSEFSTNMKQNHHSKCNLPSSALQNQNEKLEIVIPLSHCQNEVSVPSTNVMQVECDSTFILNEATKTLKTHLETSTNSCEEFKPSCVLYPEPCEQNVVNSVPSHELQHRKVSNQFSDIEHDHHKNFPCSSVDTKSKQPETSHVLKELPENIETSSQVSLEICSDSVNSVSVTIKKNPDVLNPFNMQPIECGNQDEPSCLEMILEQQANVLSSTDIENQFNICNEVTSVLKQNQCEKAFCASPIELSKHSEIPCEASTVLHKQMAASSCEPPTVMQNSETSPHVLPSVLHKQSFCIKPVQKQSIEIKDREEEKGCFRNCGDESDEEFNKEIVTEDCNINIDDISMKSDSIMCHNPPVKDISSDSRGESFESNASLIEMAADELIANNDNALKAAETDCKEFNIGANLSDFKSDISDQKNNKTCELTLEIDNDRYKWGVKDCDGGNSDISNNRGRTRSRDYGKISMKRTCPCCEDTTCPPKKCRINSGSSSGSSRISSYKSLRTFHKQLSISRTKPHAYMRTRSSNGPSSSISTRSSHRPRTRSSTIS